MVKLVDTLVLGTNANASRFESEWRHADAGAAIRWVPFPLTGGGGGHNNKV